MENIFNNTEVAFSLKTDSELERAYFLFKMIANEPLVKIGTAVTNFAIKAHLPVEGLIKASVFDHFCGGVNEDDCLPLIDKMYQKGVSSVLDYSVEGKDEESQFDQALQKVKHILRFVKEKEEIPFAVFKPTGFGRFALFKKINEGITLSETESEEWNRVINRFDDVCKNAYEMDVPLLVDAEESWMQDAADTLVEDMMRKYNKKKVTVFNTLQMYRWDRLAYLKRMHQKAQEEGFLLGFKVVRGAYMEKEREHAAELGIPSPICANKQETDENFDAAIDYILSRIDSISLFSGTHNEKSSYQLMQEMYKRGIKNNDPRIWFGQLLGMSDHISYNLAAQGYNVAKYMPFGPVRDVMPYLIRRAEENTSVSGQTSRELELLKVEKKRRKI